MSGCWDRREINQLGIVSTAAFDKEGDEVVVTVEIFQSELGEAGAAPVSYTHLNVLLPIRNPREMTKNCHFEILKMCIRDRVVEIEHSKGFSSVYGHLGSVTVVKDQKVKRGEAIGTVGETGNATGSHLHFEIRKDGIEIDPMPLLPSRSKTQ